jgi:hypothetical protein
MRYLLCFYLRVLKLYLELWKFQTKVIPTCELVAATYPVNGHRNWKRMKVPLAINLYESIKLYLCEKWLAEPDDRFP